MDFKRGKLYKCPDFYLLVYPTKEKAAVASALLSVTALPTTLVATDEARVAAYRSGYWSKNLDCQVRYSEAGDVFMFLERDGKYLHVLFGKFAGWIIWQDWLRIVEASVT